MYIYTECPKCGENVSLEGVCPIHGDITIPDKDMEGTMFELLSTLDSFDEEIIC